MVKNVNNILLTEKIRFGRYTNETQPNNSIVINASDKELPEHKNSGFYLSPIRYSPGSNIISYNSTTGEIVDSGPIGIETITQFGSVSNVHTKFKSLEVENLDVVNFTKVNIKELDNPILEFGNKENQRDVGILFHKNNQTSSIYYDENISINSNLILLNGDVKISKDLFVSGKVHTKNIELEHLKANYIKGDGSEISNLSYKQIGNTFEEFIHFNKGFETPWLSGDGSKITNLSLNQIDLHTSNTLTVGDLKTTKSIIVDGGLKVYKNAKFYETLVVDKTIKASMYYGDGTKLEGIAHSSDMEECKDKISKNDIKIEKNENDILQIKNKITTISDEAEKIQNIESLTIDVIEKINDLQSLKTLTPVLSELKLNYKIHEDSLKKLSIECKKNENIAPKIKPLQDDIKNLTKRVDIINTNTENCPSKFIQIDRELFSLNNKKTNNVDFEKVKEKNEKNSEDIKILYIKTENQGTYIKNIEKELPRITQLENEIPRFLPLETALPQISQSKKDIDVIQNELPKMGHRIHVLENKPLKGDGVLISNITLQHVVNYGNKIDGDITVGTLSFQNTPKLTSRTGEIKCIKINDIAEISGFTKANNNTTAGTPGGIVLKTKRPQGKIENSVLIDGNGKVAIGSEKVYPSAILSLDSKTCGFLPPRMTWIEMKNIKDPEPGLIVYELESDTVFVYKRSGWTAMC